MRVLVVEDERDTAEALSWGLTAEGYVVDVAGNGVDGLLEGDRERLRRHRPGRDAARPGRLTGSQAVARLSPLGHAHLNCLGRDAFTTQPPAERRPLRDPSARAGADDGEF